MYEQNGIWVVDDASLIRDIASKVLTDNGYDVRTFEHGGEAKLALVTGDYTPRILTDLEMPEYSGPELIKYIQEIDKNTHCVLMSGNPNLLREHAEELNVPFLQKPFKLEDLLSIIKPIVPAKK